MTKKFKSLRLVLELFEYIEGDATKRKPKINNVYTICQQGNRVADDEYPFECFLIRFIVPELKGDNAENDKKCIGVKYSYQVESKSTYGHSQIVKESYLIKKIPIEGEKYDSEYGVKQHCQSYSDNKSKVPICVEKFEFLKHEPFEFK